MNSFLKSKMYNSGSFRLIFVEKDCPLEFVGLETLIRKSRWSMDAANTILHYHCQHNKASSTLMVNVRLWEAPNL